MANSGGGIFSNEWVKLSDIQAALDDAPFPLTSFPLIKLFNGKSVNMDFPESRSGMQDFL